MSDWALTRCVARIRKAVGDGRDGGAHIKTIHGRGYRFVAPLPVTPSAHAPPPASLANLAPPLTPPARPPLPSPTPQGEAAAAERRVLTVLCCALVDPQARHRDPEEARGLVQAYHAVCGEVIHALEGYVAQYLRDAVIAYFGVPQAHDDDAQRSVWAGLRLRDALQARLAAGTTDPLSVQVGIHTGSVVVGELGRERPGLLAVGETPAVAERLTALALPGTVVISAATARLVDGYFHWQAWEAPGATEVAAAGGAYQVLGERPAHSRFEVMTQRGLTPLVGREAERGLLRARWADATGGLGQGVVILGEPSIGKSRLVQYLTDQLAGEPHTRIEWRCASSAHDSPWYPVLAHLHRLLRWRPDTAPEEQLHALEALVATAGLVLPEVVPLLASLLALPLPARYPPLTLSAQQQKQYTLDALRGWLLAETAQHPVLLIVEDLQWSDPSTLDLLTLLIDQGPTARVLLLLTARPEFQPPWTPRAHVTPLMLGRLSRAQVAQMITQLTRATPLPPAVVAQITAQTDGVPLFVEECTAMVLESGLLQDDSQQTRTGSLPPLAIPATLHGVLMARLDLLQPAKIVAQLGATVGRTFAAEVLQAVAPLDEAMVQHGLRQLVEAELVYQDGVGPTAQYTFKHALIQEAAYQSVLKSTRHHYHQRIAQVLEDRFPETVETQPELLAAHYTAAGLHAPAVAYWQRAGARTAGRSAHREAIGHFHKALEVLTLLPDTSARAQQELALQRALGASLVASRGFAAPEVEHAYSRARALCRRLGDTREIGPVLFGLWGFYYVRGDLQSARELAEHLLTLAQRHHDPALLLQGHRALGDALFRLGELVPARAHLEQGMALYHPQQHRAHALLYGQDPGMGCRGFAALVLWVLGYPDQALQRGEEGLSLAHELAHPFSLAFILGQMSQLHGLRREWPAVQEAAEALMALAREQGFAQSLAASLMNWGRTLAAQGRGEVGIPQLRQGLAAYLATGAELARPLYLAWLAEAYGVGGQPAEGLRVLAEAVAAAQNIGERWYEGERHRLKGDLLLARSVEHQAEAEACFQQALDVARHQQAKSWELRAAMSLGRLWQQQGKRAEAHALLAPIYGWFTEGFDTADLQEAKTLLEELGG